MNKNKTIILLVIGILVVTISSIGVTYSYMKPKTEKENNQTEIGINNCAKITLKDNNSTINLTNMYPMEEEMGLQTPSYEFTISSTCEEYTGFNLYLTTLNDNEIKDKDIRYAVTDVDDNVLITDLISNKPNGITEFSEEEIKELEQGIENKRGNTYKVYNSVIPLDKERTYKLHLWLDENANNDTMNQSFKIKVSIKEYDWDGTLAEYLISTKDRTLIYHNELPDYEGMENYELEAGDLSYRFTGGNDVVNNYVCFGTDTEKCPEDNLYRIIGLFKNSDDQYEAKLIKATFLNGDYTWSGSTADTAPNSWRYSTFNTDVLNNTYLNSFSQDWQKKINSHDWAIGGIEHWFYGMGQLSNAKIAYEYELGNNKIKENTKLCDNENRGRILCTKYDLIYPSKVALMYITDYYYAAPSIYWSLMGNNTIPCGGNAVETERCGPEFDYRKTKGNLWLNISASANKTEVTLTRASNYNHVVYDIRSTYDVLDFFTVYSNSAGFRPSFYLINNIKLISGNGTKENPYIIS